MMVAHYTCWRMGKGGNNTDPQSHSGSGTRVYFLSLFELNEVKVNLGLMRINIREWCDKWLSITINVCNPHLVPGTVAGVGDKSPLSFRP